MSRLSTLKASRKAARSALETTIAELDAALAERAWTEEEETRLAAERKRLDDVEKAYADAKEAEATAKAEQEEREQKLGHTRSDSTDDKSMTIDEHGTIRVGSEPLTFGPANPQNSYYRTMLYAASPASRGHRAAVEILERHQTEMDKIVEYAPASREAKAIRNYNRENARLSGEDRAVSTQTSSMGDFAPPLFFLPEYGAYRTYGRTLIDAIKHYPLPETGLTFNVPVVTQPSQAVDQTTSTQGQGDNQSVTERDLTSSYQSGALQTIIDNVNVSQQYLDRVGPGIAGDEIVRDDQQRQINRQLNLFAWGQVFATSGIGQNLYTDTSFEAFKFNQVVHQAKANIAKTDGVVAYPTHFLTDVDVWETVEGAFDSNNRPYVVPQGVAFNPLAVGDDAAVPEGYSGFRFAGLPAFKDQAAWVSWNGGAGSAGYTGDHVSLLADFSLAAYWLESTPVVRVLPQPGAATLTVLIQSYVYCAFVPVYPAAMQLVYGTGTQSAYLTA